MRTEALLEAGTVEDIIAGNTSVDLTAIQKFFQGLPDKVLGFGIKVVLAILFFMIGVQIIKLARKILKKSLEKANAEKGVMQFLDSFLKIMMYIILVSVIATSFGLNVAGVVTLLGSAGVAIGLAVQGSLSNFAGGVLILLLKPFRVGDYIIEDNKGNEGTVSEIQLFYTRLMTPDGKVIILPNGTLANTSLTNVSSMKFRRIDLKIGIAYDADIALAKSVAERVIRAHQAVIQDQPVDVFVDALESSEVTIGMHCFVRNADYWNTRWQLTEDLKLSYDEAKIAIPFPQLDVHTK